MYTANVTVDVAEGQLNLSMEMDTCTEELPCFASDKVADDNEGGTVNLNAAFYIGGVPSFTPYIRSKVRTTSGFIGCLGVSFNRGFYIYIYIYITIIE